VTDRARPYRIAVVSAGALLPGADGADAFWSRIVNRVAASRPVPNGRWPLAPHSVFALGGPQPDKTYSLDAYFLDSVPTDSAFMRHDPAVHLLLAVGRRAWADAVTAPLDRTRVGVIVGNIALPTQSVSELSRQLCQALSDGDEPVSTVETLNRFAVGLPAGILAQVLGLGGGSVTLDAACASSLYALKLACDELTAGRADAMLTGGMNRSDSLYTQMGFSQLRALSPSGRCAPLDAGADGLMVGEGAVVFVLKRLEDAEAHGDRVLGVIRGIGLSNDIGGGLLAPAKEGQLRAMRAAYRQAGWRPGDVDLIECHATGTPVGDAVELTSLRELWAQEPGDCFLGAVKANVGHLLTGAGAAGLLKVVLALRHETLPPTANFRDASIDMGAFAVLTEPREWPRRETATPRRAAVNAFGFGGINAHVLVEEYLPASRGPEPSENSNSPRAHVPGSRIAVVGVAAHLRDRITELTIPLDRFRVPPAELREALPQQLLVLTVAADAVDDAGGLIDPPTAGAFIGLGLDLNTTNFHFRWSQPTELRDTAGPPLTANRVMGSLGSIAASRLARAFGLGGPSFTLCSEQASGARALELAVRALERGELSQAIVGAVDLTGDPRVQRLSPQRSAGEGAVVLVLMRLDDAVRAGKSVYATIDGIGVATGDAELARERAGATADTVIDADPSLGAVSALAAVADALGTPGSVAITATSTDGNRLYVAMTVRHAAIVAAPKPAAGPTLAVQVGGLPFLVRENLRPPSFHPQTGRGEQKIGSEFSPPSPLGKGVEELGLFTNPLIATAAAHETFLRFTTATHRGLEGALAFQTALLEKAVPLRVGANLKPRLDRDLCLKFATGEVGPVLGAAFAPIDLFPTRVRLPDEPLMLVDRIVEIDAEPLSMSHGRLVTEHDVHAARWYLDNGHIPAAIAIESGQADLFLSGYLGIDFQTKGLAVYRLLDATVRFHRGLPAPDATIRYDIRIERFFRQGDTYLFRFRFDGSVDGDPLLTMRDGTAGFFTSAELAAGKGIVFSEMEKRSQPGKLPPDWRPLAPMHGIESYESRQLDALRAGDLAGCFGPAFADLPLRSPLTLPTADKLRLIDRVTSMDPRGGRYGLGLIRGEADIHPDDWFLVCHFVDDQVMPGTLMYECCLHTLRVFLLRLGWVGEATECSFEPVPGVASRLRCRGQVTAGTRTVAYEISVKELGYGPEPFAIADALMYADGKAIVDVRDFTLRLTGMTQRDLQSLWSNKGGDTPAALGGHGLLEKTCPSKAVGMAPENVFTREQVLEFATGSPSRAFGDRYRPFDHDRFIARLPAPPYSFLDRIISTTAQPWTMKSGGTTVAEYDVPSDAWYFARQPAMPYTVLLEVALQACGWTSAYVGSALHGDGDLHYRNLGGTATALAAVGPDTGRLTSRVTMTKVSKSAGMIIQHFDFEVCFGEGRPVYRGGTYFGFFLAASLAEQLGLRDVKPYEPTTAETAGAERFSYPTDLPFPNDMLRMVTSIDLLVPNGGPRGLGFVRGTKAVDPQEWFFAAHFHQDPVWPGSLGLESLLQLLQVFAARRWGVSRRTRWEMPAVNSEHDWSYRGQVTPADLRVTVQAEISRIDDDTRTVTADGLLSVDGRVIYRMNGFALRQLA
jgi:3-oxoacyl-(acyl-carrier-protein) synthase/3-hydroxymyristoyl/3-hydroxydecanoyl-(acyl carrier protein) dehydratase